ncbi:hypothetical protein [Luteococcus peritonei]|uniref:Uncharacterized protein n=1 Tax=Luteococcus peritonei TaxID=88874 RepID=A0ABW4RX40_9ACTN
METMHDEALAGWLELGEDEWRRTVAFGPAGIEAHARLRLLPDPCHPGQREWQAVLDEDHSDDASQLRRALDVLAGWTTTPHDVLVALWDGTPFHEELRARLGTPAVQGPARSYHLLRARLDEVCAPDDELTTEGILPAFVWPADRAWCLALDVDLHWAGIGAPAGAVEQLLATRGLDVVAAHRDQEVPAYR